MTSAGPHPGPPPAVRSLPDITEEPTAALVDEDLALAAAGVAFAATVDGQVFELFARAPVFSDGDTTVFDSSGIGVQDLYPGLALLEKMDISL
jgi:ornithine cyclodeaminase/alanine dehydrogenase-like protein (mu-crystallin family)